MIRNLLRGLRDVIFPYFCPTCNTSVGDEEALCEVCAQRLPAIFSPVCEVCGKQLPATKECYNCAGRKERAWVTRRALFHYTDAIAVLVHECKFQNNKRLLHYFAALICRGYFTFFEHMQCDMVIPMPLSSQRLRERGYNQCEELCRYLHEVVRIDVLVRTKNTHVQSLIHDEETRKKNVKDAFRVNGDVTGKKIVLFDDVITTGATTNAAVDALYAAGAHEVHVYALAMAG